MQNTYRISGRKGIDDLKGLLGDMQTEWWTDEDWAKHRAEAPANKAWNEAYIESLKLAGKYGEPYETSITLTHNPVLDEPSPKGSTSMEFMILDLGKE